MPDWLYRVFPLDAATLPTQLTEDEMPSWLYWTVTAVHFLPGLLIGLAAGWFLIKPVNAALGWFFRAFNRLFDRPYQSLWPGGGLVLEAELWW